MELPYKFAYGATDADGDALTYTLLAQPAEGSATDNGDGSFTFDPGSAFQDLGVGETRDVTFDYNAEDGRGGSATATITVTVAGANDAPLAPAGTFAGVSEDGAAVQFAYGATDADGDALTYTLLAQPAEGSATDNGDGSFTFDPGSAFQDLGVGETRDVTFAYNAGDGKGGIASATITVTVAGVNDAPLAPAGTFAGVSEDGAAVQFAYGATDVDGDVLSYTLLTQPAEGSATDNGDGSFIFDPGSAFQDLGVGETRNVFFGYSVVDGRGGSSEATATVTVSGINDEPENLAFAGGVIPEESAAGTMVGTASANDPDAGMRSLTT